MAKKFESAWFMRHSDACYGEIWAEHEKSRTGLKRGVPGRSAFRADGACDSQAASSVLADPPSNSDTDNDEKCALHWLINMVALEQPLLPPLFLQNAELWLACAVSSRMDLGFEVFTVVVGLSH